MKKKIVFINSNNKEREKDYVYRIKKADYYYYKINKK